MTFVHCATVGCVGANTYQRHQQQHQVSWPTGGLAGCLVGWLVSWLTGWQTELLLGLLCWVSNFFSMEEVVSGKISYKQKVSSDLSFCWPKWLLLALWGKLCNNCKQCAKLCVQHPSPLFCLSSCLNRPLAVWPSAASVVASAVAVIKQMYYKKHRCNAQKP